MQALDYVTVTLKKIFSLSPFDAMGILKQTRQKEETKITMHS